MKRLGFALAVCVAMGLATPAYAVGTSCSAPYGFSNTKACERVYSSGGWKTDAGLEGYFYNPTIINEQCDFYGQNCGAYAARSSSDPTAYQSFYTSSKPPIWNNKYRARGSWNDAYTNVRFTNAVSAFVSYP